VDFRWCSITSGNIHLNEEKEKEDKRVLAKVLFHRMDKRVIDEFKEFTRLHTGSNRFNDGLKLLLELAKVQQSLAFIGYDLLKIHQKIDALEEQIKKKEPEKKIIKTFGGDIEVGKRKTSETARKGEEG